MSPDCCNKSGESIRKDKKKSKVSTTKMKSEHLGSTQGTMCEQLKDLCSPRSLIQLLHRPCCPSSLGIARMLFGLMMVIDIPDERGLSEIDLKYGNPLKCHFPLFDWMTPLSLEYMGIIYAIMWLGAAGICLGYRFQLSCLMFTIPYWYIFLLDKTTWNNHSYLYGLLSILFTFSSAHHTYSVDSLLDPAIRNKPVPLWNYAVLRFQFFLLYFYAGVKKFDLDWIGGHSMTHLSMHWVFDPFRFFFTNEQIDLWIIHIFGFVFDLTVGFFLLAKRTRPMAILFSSAFHLMNSRIFHIGQFPYVCLTMTPIFCDFDWPDRLWTYVTKALRPSPSEQEKPKKKEDDDEKSLLDGQSLNVCPHRTLTFLLLSLYVGLQLFLPFSHFITKGYNNWTNGLYGYSWDMMVHNWDSVLTVIKVVDNDSREEFFLDPEAWVSNSRFSQHGDMLIQYATCLKRNLPSLSGLEDRSKPKFRNISVYIDVWCSLNGRFQQRMFDPRQDLTQAKWSPFEDISWLMPVISDLSPWRKTMTDLENEVLERSNASGVLFVADFPGLRLDNYINAELTNVTVTVLRGTVILEKLSQNKSHFENRTLTQGESETIRSGEFHTMYTVSMEPSCYMYSFVNETLKNLTGNQSSGTLREYDTIWGSLKYRYEQLIDSILILRGCFNKFLFDIPIPSVEERVSYLMEPAGNVIEKNYVNV